MVQYKVFQVLGLERLVISKSDFFFADSNCLFFYCEAFWGQHIWSYVGPPYRPSEKKKTHKKGYWNGIMAKIF